MKDLETVGHRERLEELGARLRGALRIGSQLAEGLSSPRGYIPAALLPRAGILRRGKTSVRHNSAYSSI